MNRTLLLLSARHLLLGCAITAAAVSASAQVRSYQKISSTLGGLSTLLSDGDRFGSAVTDLGDLAGDGGWTLAVGAPLDDEAGVDHGAVWLLRFDATDSLRGQSKILPTFAGVDRGDAFGGSLATVGDLDGDGLAELAVGARFDDDGGQDLGAVWILFLDPAGAMRRAQKISATAGGFDGTLESFDYFGSSLAAPGDLDGDGLADLVVGASGSEGRGQDRGALWFLFLDADGTVRFQSRLGEGEGGFEGPLSDGDAFGSALAVIDDLDGNGHVDLAVGAPQSRSNAGTVWLLLLDSGGQVAQVRAVPSEGSGFTGELHEQDSFGSSISFLGDLDTNGTPALAVGAPGDADGGIQAGRGAVWILELASTGLVAGQTKISATSGDFVGEIDLFDAFGAALHAPKNRGLDGLVDLVVGAWGDDDGGAEHGALWHLQLRADGTVDAQQKVSDFEGGFTSNLRDGDRFGSAVAAEDFDHDGTMDLLVGAPDSDDERGAAWWLLLAADGTVAAEERIDAHELPLTDGDRFGGAVTIVGDLDGDGVPEVAVGARGDDTGGTDRGAVYILFMSAQGHIVQARKIAHGIAGFEGSLGDQNSFGQAVAGIGDLDQDGVNDIAVGAHQDSRDGLLQGSVWILFLRPDGTVKGQQRIGANAGGFSGSLQSFDQFGFALASVFDLDGDGRRELAVGAQDESVWVLFLTPDGTVASETRINASEGGGPLVSGDKFAHSLAAVGDLDGDGLGDVAVGAPGDGDQGRGAVWLLYLDVDGTARAYQKIRDPLGDVEPRFATEYNFGESVYSLNDLDGDGIGDLVVGAPGDDDGGANRGAVWLTQLDGTAPTRVLSAISRSPIELEVTFSGPVAARGAETESSYTLFATDDSTATVGISAAGLQADATVVQLVLHDPLVRDTQYALTVEGIRDPLGRELFAGGRSVTFPYPPERISYLTPDRRYEGFALSLLPLDPSVEDVLADLGPSDGNIQWRLSRWSPALSRYVHYGETTPLDPIAPGQGFWLVTRGGRGFEVGGFAVDLEDFRIALESPADSAAFNQVGHPFPFAVSVDELRVSDGQNEVPLLAPLQNDLTSATLQEYRDGQYHALGSSSCLQPNRVYWIRKVSAGPAWLVIPPVPATKCEDTPPPARESSWGLELIASRDGALSTPVILEASRDPEPLLHSRSRAAAPAPPGSTAPRLTVLEHAGGRRAGAYVRSVRPFAPHVTWELTLEGSDPPGEVNVAVTGWGLPASSVVSWTSLEEGWTRPLAVPGSVHLASHATPRRFLLDVRATGQAVSEPRPLLLDPYPNPFVESQGFRFLLGAPAYLEVELFDVRGRRVARLTRDAAAPGEHVLEWDGRDTQGQAVAAGVYLARQRGGGQIAVHRVVKLR